MVTDVKSNVAAPDCELVDYTIEDILSLTDVQERVQLYTEHRQKFEDQIRRCSTVHGNLVVLENHT